MKKIVVTSITKISEIKENKVYYNVNGNVYEISRFINPKISNKIDKIYRYKLCLVIPEKFKGIDNDEFCKDCFFIGECAKNKYKYKNICIKNDINYIKKELYELIFNKSSFKENIISNKFYNKFEKQIKNLNEDDLFYFK